jgi:prevent-host-death family protein
MQEQNWTVVEARTRLSDLIESAQRRGPQTITEKGRIVAIVVSPAPWRRTREGRGTLADLFCRVTASRVGCEGRPNEATASAYQAVNCLLDSDAVSESAAAGSERDVSDPTPVSDRPPVAIRPRR